MDKKMIILVLVFSLMFMGGTLFSCASAPKNRGEIGKGAPGPVNPGPEGAMKTPGSPGEIGKGSPGPVNPMPEGAGRSWSPEDKGEIGKGSPGPVNPMPEGAGRSVE